MITRRAQARTLRREAATWAYLRPHLDQATNGEEGRYPAAPPGSGPSYIASYSKRLPHNAFGEVDPTAYRAMVRALVAGSPEGFEQIPLAHPAPGGRPLVNPQAGLAYDLEGLDGPALAMPPPPRIDSLEVAAEVAELYWMALLRVHGAVQTRPARQHAGGARGGDGRAREPRDRCRHRPLTKAGPSSGLWTLLGSAAGEDPWCGRS
ncbi:hypothetical protein [Ornithinimicrobium sediminis]|uniref:hypothetical protein n=1 Tax=Ornithinimicrobium sediminis TaxID=2904603 RepID=UPI001E53C349|nr:hypothetical protein [Ornithinimicrobium sediminis]MCE0487223.1 hypothetical protein [Ornithinimicrobium sediminis]